MSSLINLCKAFKVAGEVKASILYLWSPIIYFPSRRWYVKAPVINPKHWSSRKDTEAKKLLFSWPWNIKLVSCSASARHLSAFMAMKRNIKDDSVNPYEILSPMCDWVGRVVTEMGKHKASDGKSRRGSEKIISKQNFPLESFLWLGGFVSLWRRFQSICGVNLQHQQLAIFIRMDNSNLVIG